VKLFPASIPTRPGWDFRLLDPITPLWDSGLGNIVIRFARNTPAGQAGSCRSPSAARFRMNAGLEDRGEGFGRIPERLSGQWDEHGWPGLDSGELPGRIRESMAHLHAVPVTGDDDVFPGFDSDRSSVTEAGPDFSLECGPLLPHCRRRGFGLTYPVPPFGHRPRIHHPLGVGVFSGGYPGLDSNQGPID
jgi:hypothetical protein